MFKSNAVNILGTLAVLILAFLFLARAATPVEMQPPAASGDAAEAADPIVVQALPPDAIIIQALPVSD